MKDLYNKLQEAKTLLASAKITALEHDKKHLAQDLYKQQKKLDEILYDIHCLIGRYNEN